MADVLFLLHARVDRHAPALQAAVQALESRGRSVEVMQRALVDPERGISGDPPLQDDRVAGCELVVTFGGDGTFLYAASAALRQDIPMLGVNLGRLGFLAWTELSDAAGALAAWADGETEVETRATLSVDAGDGRQTAINEAALVKHQEANVIEVELTIDGTFAGHFHADGAVVATPTGSTAYAASAGGPIVDPATEAVVVVPLNPHTLATRAVVVAPRSAIELNVTETTRLVLDGATEFNLKPHARVRCSLEGPVMKVVRPPGTADFYTQLREKMGWGEPLVREGRSLRGGGV